LLDCRKKEIERAVFLMNIRPRKTLDYLNPIEFSTGRRESLIVGI